jgi:hypothetical protein
MTLDSAMAYVKLARFAGVIMLLQLGGCSLIEGMGGRRGSTAPTASTPSHVSITLRNRCNHPVEVCYGTKEKCETLKPGANRKIRGLGAGVPVRLKGTDASETADATFSMVEIDESCTSVTRLLPDQEPETDGTVH